MSELVDYERLNKIGDDIMQVLLDNKLSVLEMYVVIAEVQAFLQAKMTLEFIVKRALKEHKKEE